MMHAVLHAFKPVRSVPAECPRSPPTWSANPETPAIRRIVAWQRNAGNLFAGRGGVAILDSGCHTPPAPVSFYRTALHQLLQDHEDSTLVVFVTGDVATSAAVKAVKEIGLRPPVFHIGGANSSFSRAVDAALLGADYIVVDHPAIIRERAAERKRCGTQVSPRITRHSPCTHADSCLWCPLPTGDWRSVPRRVVVVRHERVRLVLRRTRARCERRRGKANRRWPSQS